jgi:hypothetical protein
MQTDAGWTGLVTAHRFVPSTGHLYASRPAASAGPPGRAAAKSTGQEGPTLSAPPSRLLTPQELQAMVRFSKAGGGGNSSGQAGGRRMRTVWGANDRVHKFGERLPWPYSTVSSWGRLRCTGAAAPLHPSARLGPPRAAMPPWPLRLQIGQIDVYEGELMRAAACTRVLIGPDTVLTAAHCVYSGAGAQGRFYSKWKFSPGRACMADGCKGQSHSPAGSSFVRWAKMGAAALPLMCADQLPEPQLLGGLVPAGNARCDTTGRASKRLGAGRSSRKWMMRWPGTNLIHSSPTVASMLN